MELKLLFLLVVLGITSAEFTELEIYNACNTTTGVLCYGAEGHGDCIKDHSCYILAAIFKDDFAKKKDKMRILLMGKPWDNNLNKQGGGYVAIGVSHDNEMGDDAVVECVHTEGKGNQIYGSYNSRIKGIVNRVKDDSYLKKNWILSDDHGIFCDFYMDLKTEMEGLIFDLTNKKNKFHILLAMGPLKQQSEGGDGTKVAYHDTKKIASRYPILTHESIHYYEFKNGVDYLKTPKFMFVVSVFFTSVIKFYI